MTMAAFGCVREDLDNPGFGQEVDYEDYREPADLSFVITTGALNAHFEEDGPSTRSESSAFGSWLREYKLSESHPARTDISTNAWDMLDGGVRNTANAAGGETTSERKKRHDDNDDNANNEMIRSLAFFLIDMQRNADGSTPKRYGKIVAYRLLLPSMLNSDGKSQKYFFHDIDNISGYTLPTVWLDETSGGHKYGDDFQLDKDAPGGFNGFAKMNADGSLTEDSAAADGGYPDYPLAETDPSVTESKAAILTFKYDSPLHNTANNLEKLRRGDIWALAIVNFHELSTTYKGHPIGWYIKEVIDYWHRHENHVESISEGTPSVHGGFYGIPANAQNAEQDPGHQYTLVNADAAGEPVNQTYQGFMGYNFFANAAVRQNDSGYIPHMADGLTGYDNDYTNDEIGRNTNGPNASILRHYRPLILSSNDWSGALIPGQNVHKLSLMRLPSRVSFTIANHSKSNLTVEDFELSPNFAQAAAWVFSHELEPHNSARQGNFFSNWQGAPDVMSDKAMVPFRVRTYSTMNTPEVFFEALTYESGTQIGATPEQMWFRIRVSYDGVKVQMQQPDELIYGNPISANYTPCPTFLTELGNDSWAVGEKRYYAIENIDNNYFMRYTGTGDYKIAVTNTSISNIQAQLNSNNFEYVWQIEKVSANTVKIYHPTYGYMVAPTNAQQDLDEKNNVISFRSNAEYGSVFTVSNHNSGTPNAMTFQALDLNYDPYIHVNANNVMCLGCHNKNYLDGKGSHFRIYPVSITEPSGYDELQAELAAEEWFIGRRHYYVVENLRGAGGPLGAASAAADITADNTDMTAIKAEIDANNFNHVIGFDKISANGVKIWHIHKGYIKLTGTGATDYTANPADATVFTIAASGNGSYPEAVRLTATAGGNTVYLHTDSYYNLGTTTSGYSADAHFRYYNVTNHRTDRFPAVETKYAQERTIPISVFDRTTGMTESLTEIRRNDHIRVEIGVSYEEDEQKIEFEVRDWKRSDNETTFN